MTVLATRSDATKAAITSLVRGCTNLDLVTVGQSAGDARNRVVRFSDKGPELLEGIRKPLLTQ